MDMHSGVLKQGGQNASWHAYSKLQMSHLTMSWRSLSLSGLDAKFPFTSDQASVPRCDRAQDIVRAAPDPPASLTGPAPEKIRKVLQRPGVCRDCPDTPLSNSGGVKQTHGVFGGLSYPAACSYFLVHAAGCYPDAGAAYQPPHRPALAQIGQ